MFKWSKLGKIFNPADLENSWMKSFAQSPSALVLDKVVRVYFSSRPLPDSNGQYLSYLSYVDLNRNNLFDIINVAEQAILPLGDTGTFDEFGMNPASAIQEGDEIRIYYAGWSRCESVPFNAAIGCAISRDRGETFQKLGAGPVLSYSVDEPFVLGSPRIRKFNHQWYLWYAAGRKWLIGQDRPEPVYKIRMATSQDGIHWIKQGKDLIVDQLEEHECQASPEVFFLKDKFHMFFSYRHPLGYKNKEKGYRIGYASSHDLINWTRDDTKAGIDISEHGWDSEMVSYPNIFTLDQQIYMLYQGNDIGKCGFGLAKLDKHQP